MTYPQITTQEPDTYPMEKEQHKAPELTKGASPKSETETHVDKDNKVKQNNTIKKKISPEKPIDVSIQLDKRSMCTITMHETQFIY